MAEKFTELFKMFCADVKDEVAKLCGFDVEVRDVTKNNGVKRKGLYFGEGRYSPIIYLEPYFDIKFIKNKEAINDIANQIYEIYKENKAETKKYDVENAVEHWKDAIYLEVINYEANKDVLELCPHIRFLDLAIVFRLLLYIDEDLLLSMNEDIGELIPIINNGDVTIEHDSVSIIFFKRIKENRVEVQ